MSAAVGAGMLVERAEEISAVSAALERACAGQPGLLLIEGPAGIGKSTLLAEARTAGEAMNMTVLRARGGPLEQDLTYGVGRQLLERSLGDASPQARRELMKGPARLAASALSLDGDERSISPDTGADHGLYWLVCNLAAARPVAMLVDDAHWSDAPSLRFMLYLARRLEGMPLVMILAVRSGELGLEPALLDLLALEPIAHRIQLGPLSAGGAASMLGALLERPVADTVARACYDVSGGNPFFLSELALALDATTESEEAMLARVRALPPRTVTRSIMLRLGLQGQEARAVASSLAVAGEGAGIDVLSAVAGVDHAAVVQALDKLGKAGVVTTAGPIAFVHPIVRAAVYDDLPEAGRRHLHALAARALSARSAPLEAVARQLLLSEPHADEEVVATLRSAAGRALMQGAPATAARLLARALDEPPPVEVRGEVLTELAEAEARAGLAPHATEHAREALAAALAAPIRARAALALASALVGSAQPVAAFELLNEQARQLAGDERLRLDVERATFAMWVRGAVEMPWLAPLLAGFGELAGESQVQRLALTQAALAAAYDPASSATSVTMLVRRALADGQLVAELGVDEVAVGMAVYVLVMCGDLDAAVREVEFMRADARRRGSAGGFMAAALMHGQVALARGALTDAAAEFESVLATARTLDEGPIMQRCTAFAVAWLVETLLSAGKVDAARAAVARAEELGDFDRPELVWSRYGRGLLRLQDADPAGAVDDLMAVGQAAQAGGYEDRQAPWRQWAARALSALGRQTEAVELADEQVRIAASWAPAQHGSALRARALVGDGDEAASLLGDAVALLAGTPFRLEHAFALVDHGAALRRAGRRLDAKAQLEQGMDLATRCQAFAVVERAGAELRILGARPRRLMFSGIESLTATELRVARMAAGGMSNREIAQAVFVTKKTIETHLASAYRKLDISSRWQLAEALGDGVGDAASAAR